MNKYDRICIHVTGSQFHAIEEERIFSSSDCEQIDFEVYRAVNGLECFPTLKEIEIAVCDAIDNLLKGKMNEVKQ